MRTRQTKEKVLKNGDTITFHQWGAKQATDNIGTLALFSSGDFSQLGKIRDQLIPTSKLVVILTSDDGTKVATPMSMTDCFDDYFAGDVESFNEWLAFGIEVNYGSFFSAGKKSRTPEKG